MDPGCAGLPSSGEPYSGGKRMAGGGGGVRFTTVAETHRPPSTDDEGNILAQASGQQVVWKHRSWESCRDVECSPGRHACQQAENAFGSSPTEVVELPLSKAGGVVWLTAVAEAHRPPSTDDEGKILAQVSGQQVAWKHRSWESCRDVECSRDTLVSKQKMHSAQMKVLDGIPMEEAGCLEPLLTSVLDAPLDSKPMAGNMIRNSSDLAIPQKDQTGRPMEGVTSPAPSRRSVTQLHLDSQPSGYQSMPD